MSIFDPWFISSGRIQEMALDSLLDQFTSDTNYIFVVASKEDEEALAAYALIQGKKVQIRISPDGNQKLPNMFLRDGQFIFYLTQKGRAPEKVSYQFLL